MLTFTCVVKFDRKVIHTTALIWIFMCMTGVVAGLFMDELQNSKCGPTLHCPTLCVVYNKFTGCAICSCDKLVSGNQGLLNNNALRWGSTKTQEQQQREQQYQNLQKPQQQQQLNREAQQQPQLQQQQMPPGGSLAMDPSQMFGWGNNFNPADPGASISWGQGRGGMNPGNPFNRNPANPMQRFHSRTLPSTVATHRPLTAHEKHTESTTYNSPLRSTTRRPKRILPSVPHKISTIFTSTTYKIPKKYTTPTTHMTPKKNIRSTWYTTTNVHSTLTTHTVASTDTTYLKHTTPRTHTALIRLTASIPHTSPKTTKTPTTHATPTPKDMIPIKGTTLVKYYTNTGLHDNMTLTSHKLPTIYLTQSTPTSITRTTILTAPETLKTSVTHTYRRSKTTKTTSTVLTAPTTVSPKHIMASKRHTTSKLHTLSPVKTTIPTTHSTFTQERYTGTTKHMTPKAHTHFTTHFLVPSTSRPTVFVKLSKPDPTKKTDPNFNMVPKTHLEKPTSHTELFTEFDNDPIKPTTVRKYKTPMSIVTTSLPKRISITSMSTKIPKSAVSKTPPYKQSIILDTIKTKTNNPDVNRTPSTTHIIFTHTTKKRPVLFDLLKNTRTPTTRKSFTGFHNTSIITTLYNFYS